MQDLGLYEVESCRGQRHRYQTPLKLLIYWSPFGNEGRVTDSDFVDYAPLWPLREAFRPGGKYPLLNSQWQQDYLQSIHALMADRGYPRAVELALWKGRAGSEFDMGNGCRYNADISIYILAVIDPETLGARGSWEEIIGGDPNCPGPLTTWNRYSGYSIIALGAHGAGATYNHDARNAYNFLRSEFRNYDQIKWDQNVVGDFEHQWDIVPRNSLSRQLI